MIVKSFVICILSLIGIHSCIAQPGLPKNKHIYIIPPDSFWYQVPWKDSVYILPEFAEGKIEFENGYSPSYNRELNYNIFFESFMVKQDDGGVVPFKYNNELKFIWLGDHKFIKTNGFGFLHFIMEGKVSVVESVYMDAIVESITTGKYPTLADDRTSISKTKRYYYEQRKYYFFDTSTGRTHKAVPDVLTRIFSKEKTAIRNFEKENHIDYKKRDDVLKIVLFCNTNL